MGAGRWARTASTRGAVGRARKGRRVTDTMTQDGVDLQQQVRDAHKSVAALEKALKDLSKPGHLEDLKKVHSLLGKLEKVTPQSLESLARNLSDYRRREEKERPLRFGRALKEAAEKEGVSFAPVTSDPPCYRLGQFTVEPDFRKGTTSLCYARLEVGESTLAVDRVLLDYQKYLKALDQTEVSSEEFMQRLFTAYRKTLAAQRCRPGDRVELVDLLPELALLAQGPKFLKNPTKDHFKPYGRVRLAWDLARLRRDGVLECQGRRVTLGTATIGTTKKKDRVLYLEGPGGKGQYYLSLAFVEGR